MSTVTKASVSHLAYKKLVLHCAKYPAHRVFGLLVGNKSAQAVEVVDAIPLSHHWTSLAPMAEAGLSLAVAYAASKGHKIVGVYEGPELLDTRSPSSQAAKLTEKVATLLSDDAVLFLVNNATLLAANSHPFLPFTVAPASPNGNKATSNAAASEAKPKSLGADNVTLTQTARAKELEKDVRKTRIWDRLYDFDDHLEDPTLDWLHNSAITA